MGLLTSISKLFARNDSNARSERISEPVPSLMPSYDRGWKFFGNGRIRPCKSYRDVIFFQFVKMIGVLFNDVELSYAGAGGNRDDFDKFVNWFNRYAFITWNFICKNGYAVVVREYKYSDFRETDNERNFVGFKTLKPSEFHWADDRVETESKRFQKPFIMTSDVFDCFGTSDYGFLDAYLHLAEKYLNNSDLAIDGNGHIIMVSPESENQHTNTILDADEKDEWEKDFKKSYANFEDDWVSAYFSNRPLRVNDIDLTNFDTANFEKLIKVMLIIAGHFDVPASQVPILDTSVSKGLSNGGELIYGDSLKYKTFERILQWYVVDCAQHFGLDISYTINNDPNTLTINDTQGQ